MGKKDIENRPRIVLVTRAMVIEDDKILILQRSEANRSRSGRWEFPGGKVDEGEDLTKSLEREVLEETGIAVKTISSIVYNDSQLLTSGPYKGLTYVQLVGVARKEGGEVRLSHEHDEFKWVTYDECLGYDLVDETRRALLVMKDFVGI